MAEQEKSERSGLLTSAVVTAFFGLLGGAISGFATAYVQLSTAKEQYSIERAREFQNLMNKLGNKETSRLAVLNLWQLYPEERDRKIIIAAAFAVGEPDLVELISGIDEELGPVAEVLQARVHSKDPRDGSAALRTLMRVDPVRGARVVIERINEGISLSGDVISRPPRGALDPVFELIELAKQNDTIVRMIRSNAEDGRLPVLFDYILYRADQDSDFIDRIEDAYARQSDLETFNDYLIKARFFPGDAPDVVAAVSSFIVKGLDAVDENRFEVQNALVGLRSSDLKDALQVALDGRVVPKLKDTVSNPTIDDLTRARSFALLRRIDPEIAFDVMSKTLAKNERPRELTETMSDQFDGLLSQLERSDTAFQRPSHCSLGATETCISNHAAWATWLQNR